VPEIVLRLVQLGVLALLWLFVLAAVRAIRTDLSAGPSTRAAPPRRVEKPPKAPRPRKGQARRLVVTEGALAGTTLQLGPEPVTIGRANDATLVLADDYASNRHAQLTPDGQGGWRVEDLGSTNGTFLDRTKVVDSTPVPLGVPIRIGRTVLELRS
jgi:pSer/pThr/pTyr-binding forkhead associated (FHA) protein